MKRIIIFFCFSLFSTMGIKAQTDLEILEKKLRIIITKVSEANAIKDYDKCCQLLEEAKEMLKKGVGENDLTYMKICNKLSSFYILAEQYEKAQESSYYGYQKCGQFKDQRPDLFLEAREVLATSSLKVNDLYTAAILYQEIVNEIPDYSEKKVSIYTLLTDIYMQFDHYSKAESTALQAIKSYKGMPSEKRQSKIAKNAYAVILSKLGQIYAYFNLYKKSKAYYLKSVSIVDTSYVLYSDILYKTGKLYYMLGDYDKAETFFLVSAKYASSSAQKRRIYYILSILYARKNKKDLSEEFLTKILNYYNDNGTKDITYYYALNQIIREESTLTVSDKEKAYVGMVKIVKGKYGELSDIYYLSLLNLRQIYMEKGDLVNALICSKKIMQLINFKMHNNLFSLTEGQKFKFTKLFEYNFNIFLELVLKNKDKKPERITELFDLLLLSKRIILQNTIRNKEIIENSDNEIVKSKYKKLKQIKYRIANNNTNLDTLIYLQNKATKLQKEISMQIYTEYSNFDFQDSLNFKNIKNNINKNDAVIQFVNFNKTSQNASYKYSIGDTTHYCALITKKDFKYPKLVYLCTEKELEKAISKENKFTNTAQYITNIYETDNKLYKYLFEKIEPYLKKVKVVNISASGLVHNVAFSCLKDNNNTYLKDKYLIKYYVSFADLHKEADVSINSQNTNKVALFGDMKYDLNSEEIQQIETKNITRGINSAFLFEEEKATVKLLPLPDTKQEVDSIANILSANNIACSKYTGKYANEDNFYKLDASKTNILHIATHGFYFANETQKRQFLPLMTNLNPIDNSYLKNGLFFSGASNSLKKDSKMTKISDGILSAYEICNLNLSETKLVVLSACLTGIGDIKQNEGVIGLSRAFKIAGVKYMLISLWEIPSRQTTEFMINFYKNALSNMSVEQAFNKTQQFMSEKYKNPYFWGGFILLR